MFLKILPNKQDIHLKKLTFSITKVSNLKDLVFLFLRNYIILRNIHFNKCNVTFISIFWSLIENFGN